MDIRRIYEYALQREYEGKRFFEQNAGRLTHAAAVEAFRELAEEEQTHIVFIEGLLAGLGGEPAEGEARAPGAGVPADRDVPLEAGPQTGAGADEGLFSQRASYEHLDQSVLEAMVPDLAVLRTAYLIERDFAEFYEAAAARAEGDAREALTTLAAWERGHERLFRHLHDQAFKVYVHMPWGG